MKKKGKVLALTLSASAMVAASVFGTMAYLTDTDTATNTFTVGSVGLALDEAKVNTDGTPVTPEERVQSNTYHLLPGHIYTKDPTVTVDKGSENSYIRMIVNVERIDQLEAAVPYAEGSMYYADLNADNEKDFVLEKMLNNSWNYEEWHFEGYSETSKTVGKETHTTGTYEFRYHTTVDASDAATDMTLEPLFEEIQVPGEVDKEHLAHLADVKIVVNAHAIQADGFADADTAWDAFDGQVSTTTP